MIRISAISPQQGTCGLCDTAQTLAHQCRDTRLIVCLGCALELGDVESKVSFIDSGIRGLLNDHEAAIGRLQHQLRKGLK